MEKESKFIMVNVENQYTTWRKVLAWMGFISIFVYIGIIIAGVVWANHYLDINGIH